MISLKKGLCALGFGIGLGVSLNASAYIVDCGTCGALYAECANGDMSSCQTYNNYHCYIKFPDCWGD